MEVRTWTHTNSDLQNCKHKTPKIEDHENRGCPGWVSSSYSTSVTRGVTHEMSWKFSYFLIFVDVDECSTTPCDSNGECKNTDGSFVCICNIGYVGNGFTCAGKLFLLSSFNVITASNIVTNEDIAFFNNWNLIKSLKKLYP